MKTTLFIISVILLTGLCLQAQAQVSYQAPLIPAPPQSAMIDTQKTQSAMAGRNVDTKVTHYISAKPVKEIIRFYKRNLGGWELLSETGNQAFASIFLTKDNEIGAQIIARNNRDGSSDVYVSISENQKEAAPAGRDPNWAPRYPGTIRRMYSKNKQTGQTTVIYATDEPVEAIVKFYSERMLNSGWQLKDKVSLEKIPGFGKGNYQNLVFQGWQGNCVVSVTKPQDMSKYGPANQNLTTILLAFTPER